MDLLSWAAWDLSALPEPARTLVAELVAHPAAGDRASCSLNSQAGRFDFRAERLQNRRGSGGRILVNIIHAEPRDLSVARRLADWSLAPQEKRLLIASARNLDQRELAEAFIGQLLAEPPSDP